MAIPAFDTLAYAKNITHIENEIKQEFIRIEAKVDAVDAKFTGKLNLLSWMIGFIGTISLATLGTLIGVSIKLLNQ